MNGAYHSAVSQSIILATQLFVGLHQARYQMGPHCQRCLIQGPKADLLRSGEVVSDCRSIMWMLLTAHASGPIAPVPGWAISQGSGTASYVGVRCHRCWEGVPVSTSSSLSVGLEDSLNRPRPALPSTVLPVSSAATTGVVEQVWAFPPRPLAHSLPLLVPEILRRGISLPSAAQTLMPQVGPSPPLKPSPGGGAHLSPGPLWGPCIATVPRGLGHTAAAQPAQCSATLIVAGQASESAILGPPIRSQPPSPAHTARLLPSRSLGPLAPPTITGPGPVSGPEVTAPCIAASTAQYPQGSVVVSWSLVREVFTPPGSRYQQDSFGLQAGHRELQGFTSWQPSCLATPEPTT
ncbi:hypothetical protein NDU88_004005 [Pleurodeles waltl]|uniref:Uncharacterized protein n=1 Tax=Pleurodeles waltl TaxID=8319 RepID=A0AAV7V014_PLEWA|nr:hypothetical protein NDU88_004005 [Pleurodeles waltl]